MSEGCESVVDDEKMKEAQRVAESFALDAQRTWADAQRATQALRKDRGFGMVSSPTGQGTVKCFVCGGSHFARDCPDKRHPGFHKGGFKGKRSYAAEMDEVAYYHNYYTNKGKSFGKGKGKSKSKKGMFLDAQASWLKGKNKGQDRFPRLLPWVGDDIDDGDGIGHG